MATIYSTTLVPSKLELIAPWITRQPWYRRPGQLPGLRPVGGYRLDDPAGEVGLEFHFVRDVEDGSVYQVPVTYRGAPRETDDGLIGVMEHGVLGTRWMYDGAHDPVLVGQQIALMAGSVQAQHQHLSDTPEPRVAVWWDGRPVRVTEPWSVTDQGEHTTVTFGHGDDARALQVRRLLEPTTAPPGSSTALGEVSAEWAGHGNERLRGLVALLVEPAERSRNSG